MRVLLVEPPFHRFMGLYRHYYPLGLTYIAGVLALHGHDVQVYDAQHDPETIPRTYLETSQTYAKYLDGSRTTIIQSGQKSSDICQNSSQMWLALVHCQLKCHLARIASMCHEVFRDVPVVVGESILAFVQKTSSRIRMLTLQFEERESKRCASCSTLSRAATGSKRLMACHSRTIAEYVHNKGRALIEDLDSLPIPSRDLLAHAEKYRPIDFGLVMGSRGCLYRCAFCPNQNIWGRRVRFRSTGGVLREIRIVQRVSLPTTFRLEITHSR